MADKSTIGSIVFAVLLVFAFLTFTASLITMIKVFNIKNSLSGSEDSSNGSNKTTTVAPGPGPGPNPTTTVEPVPSTTVTIPPAPTTTTTATPDQGLNIRPVTEINQGEARYTSFLRYVKSLNRSMTLSEDPCKNFFGYVCDKSANDEQDMLKDNTFSDLCDALDDTNLPNFEAMNKLKQLKAKCMLIERDVANKKTALSGAKFLEYYNAFVATLPNQVEFPALSAKDATLAKPTAAQLATIMVYLAKRGQDLFTQLKIVPLVHANLADRDYSILFDEPSLDQQLYDYQYSPDAVKAKQVKKWSDYIKKVYLLKTTTGTVDETLLAEDLDELWALDKFIADNVVSDPTTPQTFTEKTTIYTAAEATTAVSLFDFTQYLTDLVADQTDDNLKNKVTATDYNIVVTNPTRLEALATYLSGTSTARAIYNYIFIKFCQTYDLRLSLAPTERSSTVNVADEPDAEEVCDRRIVENRYLADLVDHTYIFTLSEAADREKMYKIAEEVARNVINGLKANIQTLSWSPTSKTAAINKLDNMKISVGYSKSTLTTDALNTKYAAFTTDNTAQNYYDIAETTVTLQSLIDVQLLSTPAQDRPATPVFNGNATSTSIKYSNLQNSLTIPHAILTSPFFDVNYPTSVLYGALGLLIGHEIVHGFDKNGVLFNEQGIWVVSWIDTASQPIFDKMNECVVKQYTGYNVEASPLIGAYVLSEALGDNGGIRAAYTGYKLHTAINGEDPHLPSNVYKDLTHEQLLFIAFSREMCSKKAYKKPDTYYSNAIPSTFRVLGALKNFAEFKNAFNCLATTKYAIENCRVFAKETAKTS
ncbi:unnamed protein product [Bursaphelenchus okinawaensis]|uniref:Peptidase_M13 domain-containing protein n=1 Tax=Bursaphelenchus okinawaensis TaxID=465554 RepID=A0A811LFL3_9BILA|nr:unnamed protein product [Bursaphelenchus okinawaensis]CAG9121532.1 unnamed protein product [Bursaphelenchus okinawaensis]